MPFGFELPMAAWNRAYPLVKGPSAEALAQISAPLAGTIIGSVTAANEIFRIALLVTYRVEPLPPDEGEMVARLGIPKPSADQINRHARTRTTFPERSLTMPLLPSAGT